MALPSRNIKDEFDDLAREYDRRVREALAEIYAREEASIARALSALDATRVDIIGRIAEGGSQSFDLTRMRLVMEAIDTRLDDLNGRLSLDLQADMREMLSLGNKLVDDPLIRLGLSNRVHGISAELAQVVAALVDNAADMVRGVTEDARRSISEILRRAAFGGITVQQAIDEIGSSLSSEGAFKNIAARAEAIYRTEILRIQSIATQARMRAQADEVKRAGYGFRKMWLATLDTRTRATHILAMGQTVGIDEKFAVGSEEALFPRDPALSAAESVNCRCVAIPAIDKLLGSIVGG